MKLYMKGHDFYLSLVAVGIVAWVASGDLIALISVGYVLPWLIAEYG